MFCLSNKGVPPSLVTFRYISRTLVALSFSTLAATSAWADKILVLQPTTTAFNSAPPNFQSVIQGFGLGDTVSFATLTATTPATLLTTAQDPVNGYDQVWVFGLNNSASAEALVATTQPILEAYLNAGGAVYIQSEVGAGQAAADLAQNIMQDMVSASVTHSATIGGTVPSPLAIAPTYGTTYAGRIRCTTYDAWAFRQTTGVPTGSVVMSDTDTGDTVVAFFDGSQLSGGQGRLLVGGDINLLQQSLYGSGVTPITSPGGVNVTRFFLNILADRDVPASSCGTVPVNDTQSIDAGKTGTQSVTANDFYDENSTVAARLSATANVTVAATGTWPTGITLGTTDGLISVASTVAPGDYSLTYQLCTADLPAECETADISLKVLAPSSGTASASAVPTLSETALALLAALLGLSALAAQRRRAR